MTVLERLQEDLKSAMRAGDATARDAIRMAIAALKNRRIEVGRDLDEGQELQVLTKQVKSREDSVEQYSAAGREDLAGKERAEIEVLQRYLPRQLNEDEVRAAVQKAIADVGASSKRDLGQVMKAVMARYRGQIDGKHVQAIAGELLP